MQVAPPPPPPPPDSAGPNGAILNAFQMASNARAIRNAITNLCLAGHHMAHEREVRKRERNRRCSVLLSTTPHPSLAQGALGALDSVISKADTPPRFIILLSKGGSSLAYKGMYFVNDELSATKIVGWGPKVLNAGAPLCGAFYRFNTGNKSFQEVGTKGFGGTVDAVCVDGQHIKIRRGL